MHGNFTVQLCTHNEAFYYTTQSMFLNLQNLINTLIIHFFQCLVVSIDVRYYIPKYI